MSDFQLSVEYQDNLLVLASDAHDPIVFHIAERGHGLVFERSTPDEVKHDCIATLYADFPMLKLTALSSDMSIYPGGCSQFSSDSVDPKKRCIKLEPNSVVFLRPEDVIRSGENSELSFTVQLSSASRHSEQDTHVQVGSSLPEYGDPSNTQGDTKETVPTMNMETSTITSNRPLVEETPTTIKRHYDALKEPKKGNPSQVVDSVDESFVERQNDTLPPSRHVNEEAVESQELTSLCELIGSRDQTDQVSANEPLSNKENSPGYFIEPENKNHTAEFQGDDDDTDGTASPHTAPEEHYTSLHESQQIDENCGGAAEVCEDTIHIAEPSNTNLSPNSERVDDRYRTVSPESDLDGTTPVDDTAAKAISNRGHKRKSENGTESNSSSKRSKRTEGLVKDDNGEELAPITPKNPVVKSVETDSSTKRRRGRPVGSKKAKKDSPHTSSRTPSSTPAASTRSQHPEESPQFVDEPLRVVFSSNTSTPKQPQTMKFLNTHGVKVVEKASESTYDVLVISKGELKRTPKLLMSIALGKPVVSETWITQSAKAGKILGHEPFIPSDREWDKIGETRQTLFQGKTVLVTPALKREYGSQYREVEQLIKASGAKSVLSKAVRTVNMEKDGHNLIPIGLEKDDLDTAGLIEHDYACYRKDLISVSILRGELDLDEEEFKITPKSSLGPKNKGRPKTRAKT